MLPILQNDCADNLEHCDAECCKEYSLTIPKDQLKGLRRGMILRLRRVLTEDKIKYFKLHGVTYQHGTMIVQLRDFEVRDDALYIYERCQALTDNNQCALHGTQRQPRHCSQPSMATYKNLVSCYLTPRCKYKRMLDGNI